MSVVDTCRLTVSGATGYKATVCTCARGETGVGQREGRITDLVGGGMRQCQPRCDAAAQRGGECDALQ